MDYGALAAAVVAAVVLEKLFEAVFGPLWKKFGWDAFYKLYAAMVIGSVVGFATGLNAFPMFTASPWIGRAITTLFIGAGPSVIYDLLDKLPPKHEP